MATVNEFADTLRQMGDLASAEGVQDDELAQRLATFRDIARERISSLGDGLQSMIERAEWDHMNVGFFGETQHGKSTLLECLTRGNGASIGVGRKDHTRLVRDDSTFHDIRLIDMPGIEGDEQQVLEQIAAGLQRCHVILHVIPCDKAPERLTVDRMRAHLRDEVLVFAAINVFGAPRDFAGAASLRELKARQVTEIERCLQAQLAPAYRGSFVIAGRLAHAAVAAGAMTKKVYRDRERAKLAFGSLGAARRYSGLLELERGLIELHDRHLHNVPVLTTLRVAKEVDTVLAEVEKGIAGICEPIRYVVADIRTLPEKIFDDIDDTVGKLEARVGTIVDEHRNRALETVMNAIDKRQDRARLELEMEEILTACSKEIKTCATDSVKELNNGINRRVVRLKRRIELMSELTEFSGEVDLSDVFRRLEVTFSDVLQRMAETLASLAGSLLLVFANPVIAAIAVIVSIAKKVFQVFLADPRRRRREAREDAAKELESQFRSIRREWGKRLATETESLRNVARRECAEVADVGNNLEVFSARLESMLARLRQAKANLAASIVGYLDPERPLTASIDCAGQRALVLGKGLNRGKICHGLEGFTVLFYDTPPDLASDTFRGRRDRAEWRELAIQCLRAVPPIL